LGPGLFKFIQNDFFSKTKFQGPYLHTEPGINNIVKQKQNYPNLVDEIIKERYNPATNRKEFLIRWKNYSEKENQWEPSENLKKAQGKLQKFKILTQNKKMFNPMFLRSLAKSNNEKKIELANNKISCVVELTNNKCTNRRRARKRLVKSILNRASNI
jgi:hypothetical protein